MSNKNLRPPKLLLHFFRWFCHPDLREDIEGDLLETFEEKIESHGTRKAKWKFLKDVFQLFRPGIIRPAEGIYRLNQYGMFKNYVKVAMRNLRKNARFSTINIAGLAISMSVGILVTLALTDLYSYDEFHENKERIYRVTTTTNRQGAPSPKELASASIYIGEKIKAEVPGVEKVLFMYYAGFSDVVSENGPVEIKPVYSSGEFFDFFSFNLLEGDASTALVEPNSIVLTQSRAKALFGGDEALDKIVEIDIRSVPTQLKVTGLMEDPPFNSHIQANAYISFSTYSYINDRSRTNPNNFFEGNVYLLLHDKMGVSQIKERIGLINQEDNEGTSRMINNGLQAFTDIVPGKNLNNAFGVNFPTEMMIAMIALALVVLLSASFNYTNMSLARGIQRSKEVGIRKVNGASRLDVFWQFITESIILTLFSLIIGIALFLIIKQGFLSLPTSIVGMFRLEFQWVHIPYLLLLVLVIGLIAGGIPAVFLSRVKALTVLKGASRVSLLNRMAPRLILVVFQFALSMGLIIFSVYVYRQYQYAIHYDMGFDTENVLNIRIDEDKYDLLKNELASMPEISTMAGSAWVTGRTESGSTIVSEDGMDSTYINLNHVDEKYFDLLGMNLSVGRNFTSKSLITDSLLKDVIVNMSFLKEFKIDDPYKVLGKQFWNLRYDRVKREKIRVVGVVDDFIQSSSLLPRSISDFDSYIFFQESENFEILGLKLQSNDMIATMDNIETAYDKVGSRQTFEAKFFDAEREKDFAVLKMLYTIINFLAFLAISISTMGLLGISIYSTESRMKEISIRKVLGASFPNLLTLLSKSYVLMLVIAGAIAIPLAVFLANEIILNAFAYRFKASYVDTFSGFLIVVGIGAVVIYWQVRRASRANPADLLRDE